MVKSFPLDGAASLFRWGVARSGRDDAIMIRKEDGFELHWSGCRVPRREYARAALLLAVLLAVIYGNSFHCGFHLDDFDSIVDNSRVHIRTLSWPELSKALSGVGDFHRPLAYLTFGLNHYFHGTRLAGYHGVNLALHYLAALFLFLLFSDTL
jgi:protein O-mannosyl-transferase